ncbi:MAG: hypothetical protein A2W31_00305 [Planctomycetes bacterium RBG_16_64_10]|nr:MAG: hypothetical protein A2W31_00305 [Planctomycetes bacterium RBG_16_64_10]
MSTVGIALKRTILVVVVVGLIAGVVALRHHDGAVQRLATRYYARNRTAQFFARSAAQAGCPARLPRGYIKPIPAARKLPSTDVPRQ